MTTLKSFAHDSQQHLRQSTGCDVRRSHIFELIAALFSHGSWAAMRATHLVSDAGVGFAATAATADLFGRALQLGFREGEADLLATTWSAFARQRGLRQIRRDEVAMRLIKNQRGRDVLQGVWSSASSAHGSASRRPPLRTSPLLVDNLEREAEAGAPVAYYLLACMFRCTRPNAYLHEESQRGRLLNATEQAFVSEYLDLVPLHAAYERYLRAAATAGVREAAIELAQAFPSPQARALAESLAAVDDPSVVLSLSPSPNGRVARLWARWDRGDRQALIQLADGGDPEALRALAASGDQAAIRALAVERADCGDPEALRALAIAGDHAAIRVLVEAAIDQREDLQAWTWYHVALLHGIDLANSELRAFHDGGTRDGEFYDSDFGGPLYVAGDEGIELPTVDEETRNAGLSAARALIAQTSVASPTSRGWL